jgi:tetratricopeptide (TPR) repeat protein
LKKLVCTLLFLCSVLVVVCIVINPILLDLGEKRFVRPYLSGARWAPCCARPRIRASCPEVIGDEQEALKLLEVAGGQCLDDVVRAVEKYSPENVAAAYLIRAERNGDPMDLLHALQTAKGFNRALAQERLGLTKEAIHTWDEVYRTRAEWPMEARAWRDGLQRRPDPTDQWRTENVATALRRRDRAALTTLARRFPSTAARYFEDPGLLLDRDGARLFAEILARDGEHYPRAVVDAMERTVDRETLERGLRALRDKQYELAAASFKRVGNPLYLTAQYSAAAEQYTAEKESLPLLDQTIRDLKPQYRELSARIHTLRANALEFDDRYLEAYAAYETALGFARPDATAMADALSRRSQNYTTIGSPEKALSDAVRAVSLLPRVANARTRHHTYGSAAMAAQALGDTVLGLHYRNAAVEVLQKAVRDDLPSAKHHLAIALRARAELYADRGDMAAADLDLRQAADLAEAVENEPLRDQLRMRVYEVRGDVAREPAGAVEAFTEAIKRATRQNST